MRRLPTDAEVRDCLSMQLALRKAWIGIFGDEHGKEVAAMDRGIVIACKYLASTNIAERILLHEDMKGVLAELERIKSKFSKGGSR